MATNGMLGKVPKLYNVLCMQNSCCRNTCNTVKCWKWDLSQIIDNQINCKLKYAVLILNRAITQNQEFVKGFWNNASIRITVDGGTTHWDTFLSKLSYNDQDRMKLPDLITGDFDSIAADVLQKYKGKVCKIYHTPNQDYTDFTKAIIELNNYCKEHDTELDHVMVICQNSGRIDQILGNIQTLYHIKQSNLLCPKTKVYILSDDSVSWLLCPGDHVISIPEETRKHKKSWCSLIPVGEACTSVTTYGLKWNLDNQQLKFGVLVSTSNTFDGSELVKIKCSHTLLWSMKLPSIALAGQ